MSAKVALVTGGSSGIGEATALALQDQGYTTYAAARRLPRLEQLASSGVLALEMDVTEEASMQAGVERVLAEQGRIDVLVNNAGYGSYGAIEDVPLSEARHQFEVNVFGAIRLTQLVLPHMREQHSGTIVNITSMGGRIYTPLGGWYHATKFALEALSDCLRLELKRFGVNVVVIEPGDIKTEWGAVAGEKLRAVSGSGPYGPQATAMAKSLGSSRRFQSSPALVAKTVVKAVTSHRPRTRYAVGYGAKPMIWMHDVLPDRAFDAVVGQVIRLP